MNQRLRVYLIVIIIVVISSLYIIYNGLTNRGRIEEEKIEFTSTDCTEQQGKNGPYWFIQITLKNSGSSEVSISNISLDNNEIISRTLPPNTGEISTDLPMSGLVIEPNTTQSIIIMIDFKYNNLKTFQRVQVSINTQLKEYSVNVVLL
jgi:hypothetical protein